ncbi:HET-domain-containing protein, partial [Hyaloscypha variabilis F]
IQCSLKDATLAEYRDDIADHYVALSYVWGDANDKRCIMVDGKRLDITASLDSALRHIRDARRVLHVWADGVCINQNDVVDRNRQVRLMGEIYSSAEHTIIFLGVSSPQCEFALKRIKALLSKSQMKSTNDPTTGKYIESIIEDNILAHAWFTRVWIFQELLLSKDPWLQCGVTRIRWEFFCNYVLCSASSLWKPESRIVLENMNQSRINLKMSLETGVDNSDEASNAIPDTTLFTYMSIRRGYGLSDPRDMVYAHVGLTPIKTRHTISIDYDKTVAQTYEDIALFCMEAIGVLPMLLFVEKVQPEQRRRSLPSWVPDW